MVEAVKIKDEVSLALKSFDAIMTVVDKRRPFVPEDFVSKYYDDI